MKKKRALLKTACRLFAEQGFDGTTTLQISQEAKATEPLIFYHFKGKEGLFTAIIETAFAEYFKRFDDLPQKTDSAFERIENLIQMHMAFIEAMPHETQLIISGCPAKIKDPDHICGDNFTRLRKRLRSYLIECLKAGTASGEFRKMPVSETADILMALLNGLARRQSQLPENARKIRKAAVSFCRWSLVKP